MTPIETGKWPVRPEAVLDWRSEAPTDEIRMPTAEYPAVKMPKARIVGPPPLKPGKFEGGLREYLRNPERWGGESLILLPIVPFVVVWLCIKGLITGNGPFD